MLSFFRWSLVSVTVVVLTACGGGSSDSGINSSGQQDSGNASTANSEGNTVDQGNETGNSTDNPVQSNNETYIDNNGDIVPVLSEKPDVLDINLDTYDVLTIRIMRNINLNSELSKSALSSYSAPTENLVFYDTNVAVDIDVNCEDYGFNQSDLSFSQTLENGIKYKIYSKKEYIDNTDYYTVGCEESDFESVPSYSDLSGGYTIIQSDIWRR